MNQAKFLVIVIILLLPAGIIFKSCTKSEDDTRCDYSGEVISYVYDKCACCPGWVIVTGFDTLKFEKVPENGYLWDLVYAYGFPVDINFSYKNTNDACVDSYKEMTCIDLHKEINCSQSGLIIEYDYTECLCCPGWLIKTGNDTIKTATLSNETILWDVVETKGFPIEIMFDYKEKQGACKDFYIEVTCITLMPYKLYD